MNCQKVEDLLCAYIDGEVTGRQCDTLETHLELCEGCQEEMATLRSAIALLEAPKTMVRPEGLLEEFKAEYLPAAEAAPAPRWGIRLPVMPAIEWPSLSRMLLPMGGLAAAAAAALLVGVHSQSMVGSQVRVASPPVACRVAVVPIQPEAVGGASTIAAPVASVAAKRSPLGEHTARPQTVSTREPILPVHSEPRTVTAPHTAHRAFRHRALMLAALTRPAHRKHQRTRSSLIANRPALVPAVTEATLAQAVRQHEAVVPSPEAQWQDQVVMIRRTATAAAADDGYGEASSKDVVTGSTDKFAAIGTAPSPAIPAGEPAGDSGGNK